MAHGVMDKRKSLLLLYLVLTPQLTGALHEAVHQLDELL
ncbi:hypothetical protein PR003_g22323 [Phytophthora rubi]|uniref:Peroxisomal membrane protein PEX16 n=1 Tax=Phytophthora rubi TaxID=129364 RepID=A0A6A3NBF6_9STRA|nr:hypothetical protein PR002_g5945 [Phytophthora rubi]KAE9302236.1 hypothetical protein PR003_g22323 [Phytophthora rubi]